METVGARACAENGPKMHTVEIVLLLLMLGAVSGLAARYLAAIALPLLQIALGAVLSWPDAGLHVRFDPELFLLLFIPPLLFADGWRIPKREFFALRRPILTLALGLVLFTVIGLGYFVHWMVPGMPLTVAFALAAVLSPTDAVAVSAIIRRLGMPEKTMHILQGESLLNDASGLVALKFAVAATLTGVFSWSEAGRSFLFIAVGGVAVGTGVGWGFAVARNAITRRLGDTAATQTVLLLMLLPFAAYILGENLGVSGILAAVAAGIATNFADLERSESIAERMQAQGAWAVVESAFNGAIFLLLGLQLPAIMVDGLTHGPHAWWRMVGYVLAISAMLVVLRGVWLVLAVRRSMVNARRRGQLLEAPTGRLMGAATLAGIRGAITLAGALSVPLLMPDGSAFPGRELLVFLATGVILVTLVVGSVGLPLLLRGLPQPDEPPHAREERLARVAAYEAAVVALQNDRSGAGRHDAEWQGLHDEAAGRVARGYRRRIETLDDADDGPETDQAERAALKRGHVLELELRLAGLHAERTELYRLRREHRINDDSLRTLVQEVDLSEISLRRRLVAAQRASQRG
ncbi:sodium/proton antiporter (CPA1 family) [Xylophilus ampelinus]|uniref:Sodium/proton antiporter (CPA1 family) n=2 Tax=Xylophilus ampelinus TaxID=54067 RepID=A0A318SGI2_9BURK|nr:sodium/proton antiporter (CPA1 family) [Xylophilus ampelinus]